VTMKKNGVDTTAKVNLEFLFDITGFRRMGPSRYGCLRRRWRGGRRTIDYGEFPKQAVLLWDPDLTTRLLKPENIVM